MSAHAVEDARQKSLHTDWRENWEHRVENARSRPAMFIGNLATAHRSAVSDALALVRKAKAFRAPKTTEVYLSPTKYVIRAEAGPLLPAIEYLHTWYGKHYLAEGWHEALERLRQERFGRLFDEQPDFVGWKKYFAGASGPTLESPLHPAVLACRFASLYKTSAGFWGQIFENGRPLQDPFLLVQPSEVGLLVLAQLDPHWFQGLPFTADDVQKLSRNTGIAALWYADDKDLDVEARTVSDFSRWL